MSINLRIMLVVVALVLFIVVFTAFRKGRIPLKYSLVWLLPDILLSVIAFSPDYMWKFTELIGFQTISNLVIGIFLVMLFFICISLTIIVSGQKTKITLLIQEISMLEKEISDLKSKKNKSDL